MRGLLRISVALVVLSVAATISAASSQTRLLTATFTGGCDAFTVAVTGEGLNQPNPVVSYNITLTPRSGEPMTIVDSFEVTPKKDGSFYKTVTESWKKFEYTPKGKYVLSGSAILTSKLIPLHDLKIRFSRPTLNCDGKRWNSMMFSPMCKLLVLRYLENERVREPQFDALRWGMTCGA